MWEVAGSLTVGAAACSPDKPVGEQQIAGRWLSSHWTRHLASSSGEPMTVPTLLGPCVEESVRRSAGCGDGVSVRTCVTLSGFHPDAQAPGHCKDALRSPRPQLLRRLHLRL